MNAARLHGLAQQRAAAAVYAAVAEGRLPHASTLPCEGCGAPAVEHHHHAGYEPAHHLDVTAVCRKCHRRIHNGTLPEPRTGQLRTKPARRLPGSEPFPRWLLEVRKARKLRQLDLGCMAERLDLGCGIHQVRVSEWELGKSRPSLRQFRVLCQVLGLDAGEQARGQELWDAAEIAWERASKSSAPPLRTFTAREADAVVRAFCGAP